MTQPRGREAAEITALLEEAETIPFGPQEQSLLKEAARRADDAGEEELAYRARMLLTPSAHMTGDTDTMISSFGWCVGKHDQDPVRFPIDPGVHTDLLFQFKWMASRLASNSAFPRERVESVHVDMERRYREAGVGITGVLQSRHEAALLMGDVEEAGRLIVERNTHERDAYSHCEACVRADDASYAQLTGDDAEAIRLWEEIEEQGLTCGEEPEYAQADILLALLRAGRGEEAIAVHARSYRAARSNPDGLVIIARHLAFCAVTGNLDRGLQLLERHLGLLAVDAYQEANHLEGLASIGVLLDALVDAGHADAPVRGSDDPALEPLLGPADGPRTVAQLRDLAWAGADAIAARFDARNGNDRFAGVVAAKRALREVRYALPFGSEVFAPTVAASTLPTDADGWLARARLLQIVGDLDGARAAVESGHGVADVAQAPVLLRARLQIALAQGEAERAEELRRELVDAHRAAGQVEHAAAVESLGTALFDPADGESLDSLGDALLSARDGDLSAQLLLAIAATLQVRAARAEDAALQARIAGDEEEADAHDERIAALTADWIAHAARARELVSAEDPHGLFVGTLRSQLRALLSAEQGDDAAVLIAEQLADPRAAGQPLFDVLESAATLHGSRGEFAEGLALADRALGEALAVDQPLAAARAGRLSALLLSDLGQVDEAISRLGFTLRQLERAEETTTGVRFLLGRMQSAAGRHDEALESFESVYLEEREQGAPPLAVAETALALGHEAESVGEIRMAYGTFQEALELAEEGEDPAMGAQAGLALGAMLARGGFDGAVETLDRAVELAETAQRPDLVCETIHQRGQARAAGAGSPAELAADLPAILADLDRAIGIAREQGGGWTEADVLDSRGQILLSAGDLDRGIPAALQAADAFAAVGDVTSACRAEWQTGRRLAEAGRPEEAASVLSTSLERCEEGTGVWNQIAVVLADVYDTLGRGSEATQLRAVAGGAAEDGPTGV
ncbi:hypothetical protein ACXET9_11225 [Brachybacterium sp. DNPG3]